MNELTARYKQVTDVCKRDAYLESLKRAIPVSTVIALDQALKLAPKSEPKNGTPIEIWQSGIASVFGMMRYGEMDAVWGLKTRLNKDERAIWRKCMYRPVVPFCPCPCYMEVHEAQKFVLCDLKPDL